MNNAPKFCSLKSVWFECFHVIIDLCSIDVLREIEKVKGGKKVERYSVLIMLGPQHAMVSIYDASWM